MRDAQGRRGWLSGLAPWRRWYRIAPRRGGAPVGWLCVDRVRRSVALDVVDPAWRSRLEEIVESPVHRFVAGGRDSDGRCWDAVAEVPGWDPRALDAYRGRLQGQGLRLEEVPRPSWRRAAISFARLLDGVWCAGRNRAGLRVRSGRLAATAPRGCRGCGAALPAGSRLCPSCGEAVDGP